MYSGPGLSYLTFTLVPWLLAGGIGVQKLGLRFCSSMGGSWLGTEPRSPD